MPTVDNRTRDQKARGLLFALRGLVQGDPRQRDYWLRRAILAMGWTERALKGRWVKKFETNRRSRRARAR